MFTKKEIKHLIITIFILGFIFGFDDGRKIFALKNWLLNLAGVTLIVAFSILIRELVVKLKASRHDAKSEYEIWLARQMWFRGHGKLKYGVPFGIFIALLLTIISRGNVFFTGIGGHNIKEDLTARAGRKRVYIQDKEIAQIGLYSIWANVLLVIAGVMLKNYALGFEKFIEINMFIALFNMIPIGNLDGAKILFGNMFLYILNLIFLIVAFLLIKQGLILGIVIAFIAAVVISITWYYFYKYK